MPSVSASSTAVIGGGLAGCECAFALARAEVPVTLFEMKPQKFSPAHTNPGLAELVCSNSLRSNEEDSAIGLLKMEMRDLGSLILRVADSTQVPAGKALAVDRELFSLAVTREIEQTPGLTLCRAEISALDPESCPALAPFSSLAVCAGPLASPDLAASLAALVRRDADVPNLYFYDAIAPIVHADSVNLDIAFWGSRYHPEDKDYLNCPMGKEEYLRFRQALLDGAKAATRDFEKEVHFEGCMPVEALAERGEMTLAFGPLKPVGFIDPRTGQRPFALLQLRAENLNKSALNLVGCQTKLTYPEQKRIFRLIPGLENAEFARFGSMHRNTFVNAPKVLAPDLSLDAAPHIHLAGQITGVEGYVESAACGLWLGLILTARTHGRELPPPPPETALGALLAHLRTPAKNFQPSNAQFGLMPELGKRAGKKDRKKMYAARAREAFKAWAEQNNLF